MTLGLYSRSGRSRLSAGAVLRSVVPVLAWLLVTACTSGTEFGGTIAVLNNHAEEVEVTISGFEQNPPVGVLVGSGVKISILDAMAVPESIVIHESRTDSVGAVPAARLFAVIIPRPPADLTRDDVLRLVRTKEGCWVARWNGERAGEGPGSGSRTLVEGKASCTPTEQTPNASLRSAVRAYAAHRPTGRRTLVLSLGQHRDARRLYANQ